MVDQTITGLAQGRRIEGKVLFLGGPLYFFKALQREFVRALGLSSEDAVFPDMGRYAVAMGSALYAEKAGKLLTYEELVSRIEDSTDSATAMRALRSTKQASTPTPATPILALTAAAPPPSWC